VDFSCVSAGLLWDSLSRRFLLYELTDSPLLFRYVCVIQVVCQNLQPESYHKMFFMSIIITKEEFIAYRPQNKDVCPWHCS
jgi:hypothetical protein